MLEIKGFCGGICATNGYLVTGESSASSVLVDAPEGMADWVDSEGAQPEALLLTHQHFDHVEDVAKLVERFDLPVHAWSMPSVDLTLADWAVAMGASRGIEDYTVREILEPAGESVLEVGGMHFEILHIPGHSPDSICFHHVEERVVFGGDVLMCGSYGRTDFPHGDAETLFRGIREKLFVLPAQTHVLPGHGPVTTTGAEAERGLIP